MTCPKCGEKGILDIIYDYENMRKIVNKEYFKNVEDKTILRYQPLMSIDNIDYDVLAVGNTPFYEAHHLQKKLGSKKIYLKDEGLNPSASLKDRASLVGCIKAIENNKKTICCSSTGNAASSLACNAAKLGLETVIFVPKRAPLGKLTQLVAYGANVKLIKGDYKETFAASKIVIDKLNYYNRNAAINPHLVEGKKTVAFEIAENLNFEVTDYVFVSVGDGCTIAGVYKGFYDLKQLGLIKKIPKIVGVQSEGCAPIYRAWKHNEPVKESAEETIADSIAVGIPRNPVKALNAVKKSDGFYMTVSDDEIIKAIITLANNEGVFAEPAGATSYAGYEKALKTGLVKSEDTVTIIITGNGLKDLMSIKEEVKNIDKLDIKDIKKYKNNPNEDHEGLLKLLKLRGEDNE